MKDYSIRAVVNGAELTFCVSAYDWKDAQEQVDKAYRGQKGYDGTVEITEFSTLPGAKDAPPTPQQDPGVYSPGDRAYWGYIRENLRCQGRINPDALATVFRTAQDTGVYTTDQLMAISKVVDDAVIETIYRTADAA